MAAQAIPAGGLPVDHKLAALRFHVTPPHPPNQLQTLNIPSGCLNVRYHLSLVHIAEIP